MAQQQPPMQPGMNAGPGPGFGGDPTKPPAVQGQWSSSLFDCFDDLPSCLITYFCGCVGHGMVQGRTDGKPWGMDSLLFILGAYFCCAHCWYFGAKRRASVRAKYGLPEDPCGGPLPPPPPLFQLLPTYWHPQASISACPFCVRNCDR